MIELRLPQSRSDNDPPYFQFAHLKEITGLVHGIFTRQGGLSAPPYDSLNTSLSSGDEPAAVYANRERIARAMGAGQMIFPRQVHGDRVVTLFPEGKAATSRGGSPETDGLITSRPGLLLAIQVADCQAVLIADPVRRAIANVHAGWRGTTQNIAGRTVRTMIRSYGCRPRDLRIGIGPSLGPCCAEFIHYRREIPRRWWPYKDARHHFDFWAITREQLTAVGVPRANIVGSGLCTRCHPELFFSYRHAKTTGRFAAVIGLRDAEK